MKLIIDYYCCKTVISIHYYPIFDEITLLLAGNFNSLHTGFISIVSLPVTDPPSYYTDMTCEKGKEKKGKYGLSYHKELLHCLRLLACRLYKCEVIFTACMYYAWSTYGVKILAFFAFLHSLP